MPKNLTNTNKETFFSELHSLLASGLDFSHAFRLLIDGEKDTSMREILSRIYTDVVAGSSLNLALSSSGKFSTLDSGVVRIGEETGLLADALAFLTDYYHRRIAQTRMISSSVSYPLVILVMAIIVVIFMLAVIVPMFEQVYARMGGQLPAMTRWIIGLSKNVPAAATIAVIFFGSGAFLLHRFREKAEARSALSAIVMATPVVGEIVRRSIQASFCKLLFLLTSSGIPLLQGIEMLTKILKFYPYQQSLKIIARGLENGELLSENLEKFPHLYDRKLATLLRVGEETGRLPQMLAKQADDLTRELEHRLRTLGNLLEPALILVVGALVATILIAMYLPMFRLGGVMG